LSEADRKIRMRGVAMAAIAACLCSFPALSEDKPRTSPDTVRELASVRQQMAISQSRKAELAEEIGRLEKDRASINRMLIDSAARNRKLEGEVRESEDRLAALKVQEQDVKESLDGRREVLAEVLGALQRMGTNPPPALLVTPQDALSSVRSSILLGAVVPELRTETEILLSELNELARLGEDIDAERRTQANTLRAQADEEARLNLVMEEKRKLTAKARQELAEQSARAAALGARETDIEKLTARMEREIAAVQAAAQAAKKAEEKRLAREQKALESARQEKPDFSDTGRIEPAMAFEDAKGLLPRPVDGVEMQRFGTPDSLGEAAAGISIATTNNAVVSAPADGWIVYAGPFRSYGQLLILNGGNGYHVVLAGMEQIEVQLGQFVLAGEPVATMGDRRLASIEAIGVKSAKPVLYVEFRKDGQSIDPTPWWADTTTKRVADDS
jgi:septal ring factor EnvC (AmiA/AmiB activator)